MVRFLTVAVLLVALGCSRSDPAGRNAPPDAEKGANADLARRITGTWEMADGSDYVIEFTREGTMSVRNKAGERQIRPQGEDKDIPYRFTSATEVKAQFAPARGSFKEEAFVFSVSGEGDRLTLAGDERGTTIILSQDGVKKVVFPGSASKPLELVRQKK